MAQFSARRSGEMQRTLLEILGKRPEGSRAKEILELMEKTLQLTEYEKAEYPKRPGVRRFEKLVRFSTIPLVKAGWLLKSKGVWTVTKEGLQALKQFPDAEQFRHASVTKYREWAAGQI